MPDQPVVYEELYSARCDQLRRDTERRLTVEAGKASAWVAEAIREAYTRGVVDGFAQGVAARAAKKEQPS